MTLRRIGPDPHAGGQETPACYGCPDLFELDDGDFAVVGVDCTDELLPHLPPSAGCGPDERIVRVPRRIMVGAKAEIPDA